MARAVKITSKIPDRNPREEVFPISIKGIVQQHIFIDNNILCQFSTNVITIIRNCICNQGKAIKFLGRANLITSIGFFRILDIEFRCWILISSFRTHRDTTRQTWVQISPQHLPPHRAVNTIFVIAAQPFKN